MVYFTENRQFEIPATPQCKLFFTAIPQYRNTAIPQYRNTACNPRSCLEDLPHGKRLVREDPSRAQLLVKRLFETVALVSW